MIASEVPSDTPRYAGLPRRVVAGLLDLAIGWAAYSVVITLVDPNAASEYATTGQTALAALIVLAIAALWLGYFVFAQRRWGQRPGESRTIAG